MKVTLVRKVLGIVLCQVLVVFLVGRSFPVPQRATGDNKEMREAADALCSANPEERAQAKDAIFRMGSSAVPFLVAELDDLLMGEHTIYANGRELDAKRALARYETAILTGDDKERQQALEEVTNLVVTSRFRNDIIELLGRLKAVQAIPSLIAAMRGEQSAGASEQMSMAMRSLVEIGRPSVPPLLKLLEDAETVASSAPNVANTKVTQAEKRISTRLEVLRIRARAAMVLGEIGDPRALPVLEGLLSSSQDQILAPYVAAAINRIRTRAK
jgi:HEAT repeat protein